MKREENDDPLLTTTFETVADDLAFRIELRLLVPETFHNFASTQTMFYRLSRREAKELQKELSDWLTHGVLRPDEG